MTIVYIHTNKNFGLLPCPAVKINCNLAIKQQNFGMKFPPPIENGGIILQKLLKSPLNLGKFLVRICKKVGKNQITHPQYIYIYIYIYIYTGGFGLFLKIFEFLENKYN